MVSRILACSEFNNLIPNFMLQIWAVSTIFANAVLTKMLTRIAAFLLTGFLVSFFIKISHLRFVF